MNILIVGTKSALSRKVRDQLQNKNMALYFKEHKQYKVYDSSNIFYDIKAIIFDVVIIISTCKKGLDSEVYYSNFIYPMSLLEKLNSDVRIVYLDTTAYEYRSDAYAVSKKMFNVWLQSSEYYSISIRVEHMYGYYSVDNISSFLIRKMLLGEDIDLSVGKQVRSFVHVDDVASAIMVCIETIKTLTNNTRLDVASDEPISIKELALTLKHILKSSSRLNFGAISVSQDEFKTIQFDNSDLKMLQWCESKPLLYGLEEEVEEVRHEVLGK